MKKNFQWITGIVAVAIILALTLGMSALGETVANDTTAADAKETAQIAETEQTTALQDAMEAYSTAKRENRTTEMESELTSMVEAGQLTQEQADLILNYVKERASLQNGVCPDCGYEFQSGAAYGRQGGGKGGRGGRGMGFGSRMN